MSEERHIITDGYILKTSKSGDSARYFTFLSPLIGINNCIAFGAERFKSRFCSTIQPFVKAKLFLYRQPKNNQFKIEDISDIDTNDFLKKDINFIYLLSFFTDILSNCYISFEEYKSYYFLFSYTIDILKSEEDINKSFLFFVSKFLFLSGYSFNLNGCLECGSKENSYYFDIERGGILCNNCAKSRSYPLTASSVSLFKSFFEKRYSELKLFNVNKIDFNELLKPLLTLLRNIFEKNLRTFDSILSVFQTESIQES